MISVPMIYVNPITGLHAGKIMFCYVCHFNTRPVVAVFVKPEALEEPGLLEAVRKLKDDNPKLESFVVCLSGPNNALETKLLALYQNKSLNVPLTVLPSEESKTSIYQTLPIRPEAKFTMILYRGRQIEQIKEDESFFGEAQPISLPKPLTIKMAAFLGLENTHTNVLSVKNISHFGATSSKAIDDLLDNSPTFKELDDAAKAMIG